MNAHDRNQIAETAAAYDVTAVKKPTNLSINSDLLEKARALKLNLSATLEEALRAKLSEHRAKQWQEENREAIDAYNAFIAKNGIPGDKWRMF